MDWITENVAIGNYLDALDAELLAAEGIQSLLCLDANHRPGVDITSIAKCETIDLIDGPGNETHRFQRAVKVLIEFVEDHTPVLVHCHAGRSRSPLIVAGYLVVCEKLEPEAAVARVAEKREINISQGLEDLLYWL